jgi:hypothetical protein
MTAIALTRPAPTSPALPTVRQLLVELAATEDALRALRGSAAADRRLVLVRRQARIIRELRRRHGSPH